MGGSHLTILCAVTLVMILCLSSVLEGRPTRKGKFKHTAKFLKKLKFAQWIVSVDDEYSSPEDLQVTLTLLTARPALPGQADNATLYSSSPIAPCVQSCVGNSSSVTVSNLHSCTRECMANPHRYDNSGVSPGEADDDEVVDVDEGNGRSRGGAERNHFRNLPLSHTKR